MSDDSKTQTCKHQLEEGIEYQIKDFGSEFINYREELWLTFLNTFKHSK